MTLRHSEIGSQLFEATYVPFFNVRNAQEDIAQMNVEDEDTALPRNVGIRFPNDAT